MSRPPCFLPSSLDPFAVGHVVDSVIARSRRRCATRRDVEHQFPLVLRFRLGLEDAGQMDPRTVPGRVGKRPGLPAEDAGLAPLLAGKPDTGTPGLGENLSAECIRPLRPRPCQAQVAASADDSGGDVNPRCFARGFQSFFGLPRGLYPLKVAKEGLWSTPERTKTTVTSSSLTLTP